MESLAFVAFIALIFYILKWVIEPDKKDIKQFAGHSNPPPVPEKEKDKVPYPYLHDGFKMNALESMRYSIAMGKWIAQDERREKAEQVGAPGHYESGGINNQKTFVVNRENLD